MGHPDICDLVREDGKHWVCGQVKEVRKTLGLTLGLAVDCLQIGCSVTRPCDLFLGEGGFQLRYLSRG